MARETELADAFVDLADTLVSDYDVTDLLYRLIEHCVHLLDVAEAGLLLSDQRGSLHVMACSDERARLLELFQLQADEGPCLDCFRTGEPVAVGDLREAVARWPRFAPAAIGEGYAAVHALPMRLRAEASAPSICSAPIRVSYPKIGYTWLGRWPTWPLSASCRNAPSTAARRSSSNSKAP
jgi:GAF domain-containing protein